MNSFSLSDYATATTEYETGIEYLKKHSYYISTGMDRLGITAIVDRILVFKDGRIAEDGSHKQLMAQNGHYAEMYRAQAQWYV